MHIPRNILAALLKAQFWQSGDKHFYKTLGAAPLIGHTQLCVYIEQADATDEPPHIDFAVEFDKRWPTESAKWDVRQAFSDMGGIAPHGEEIERAMPAILALFEQHAKNDYERILHNDNLVEGSDDHELDLDHVWL